MEDQPQRAIDFTLGFKKVRGVKKHFTDVELKEHHRIARKRYYHRRKKEKQIDRIIDLFDGVEDKNVQLEIINLLLNRINL